MVTIGIGIGLPWGLMDGLAVSVVDKERAGMATGIFNAARVSADGLAIAIVGALLATLIQTGLINTYAGMETNQSTMIDAANRIAMGDLANASVILPEVGRSVLIHIYDQGFQIQLYILAVASVVTALLILALLGSVRTHDAVGI